MKYEDGCDKIGLSLEWGHAVPVRQFGKGELNDESHMKA